MDIALLTLPGHRKPYGGVPSPSLAMEKPLPSLPRLFENSLDLLDAHRRDLLVHFTGWFRAFEPSHFRQGIGERLVFGR